MLAVVLCLICCACSPAGKPGETGNATAESTPSAVLSTGEQTITGIVLSGGDQTQPGLIDAPRNFVYLVQLESGEEINVTYTAYPPSPVRDAKPAPKLVFDAGQINMGDSLTAFGMYDAESKTLTVSREQDFIETKSQKP